MVPYICLRRPRFLAHTVATLSSTFMTKSNTITKQNKKDFKTIHPINQRFLTSGTRDILRWCAKIKKLGYAEQLKYFPILLAGCQKKRLKTTDQIKTPICTNVKSN
jgi:hypothetical protein